MADSYVDGNAVAGALSILFGTDVTTARGTCGRCGNEHEMATTRVYLRNPGMVLRCPGCAAVEIVITDIRGQLRMTVRSLSNLHFS